MLVLVRSLPLPLTFHNFMLCVDASTPYLSFSLSNSARLAATSTTCPYAIPLPLPAGPCPGKLALWYSTIMYLPPMLKPER